MKRRCIRLLADEELKDLCSIATKVLDFTILHQKAEESI
jgi:hypothetical protein